MKKQVLLLDAGTGNLRSVQHALLALGAEVIYCSRPEELKAGGHMLLPGVGAFGKFMTGLKARGLDRAVLEAYQRGDPILGICVGMQALFDVGREMGETPGLGLLPGEVIRFSEDRGVKIPHTGWNQVCGVQSTPLLKECDAEEYAYFNHSYYCNVAVRTDVVGETDYGGRFACMVQRDNLFGVQFHPEKSQRFGLALLNNFLNLD
jgi:imidazole glycerol-phosphate synthase subunit HisH